MEGETDTKELIPTNLDSLLDPNKKPDLSSLPHLQRLSGLVYVYMQASSRFDEQGKKWLHSPHKDISLDELLKTPEFKNLWPLSETQSKDNFPAFMAKKLHDLGDPFGFDEELMRAAFEMAKEVSYNQMFADELTIQVNHPEWTAEPLNYFQSTMFSMYHDGPTVGRYTSRTKFPAFKYWNQLFPEDVRTQIDDLENSLRTKKLNKG